MSGDARGDGGQATGETVGREPTAVDPQTPLYKREPVIIGLTAVFVLVFQFAFSNAPIIGGYDSLATLILIWGIFAMGYDLLHGYTGLLSFGHAAFWGMGGLVAGMLVEHLGVDFPLVLVAAGLVVGVLTAWVIGWLSLRRGGIYFAILTLAFGQMIYFTMLGPMQVFTGGDDGLRVAIGDLFGFIPLEAGVPLLTPLGVVGSWMYMLAAVITVVTVAFAYRVLNSPYGMVFVAIKENEQRAEFIGLNVWRYKLMAFILSGGIAGLAGGLHTVDVSAANSASLYWVVSGDVVVMSILGGVGTLFGGIVGAAIYLYFKFVMVSFIGPLWHLVLGAMFVAVIVLFPNGIWGGVRFVALAVRDPAEARAITTAKFVGFYRWLRGWLTWLVTLPGRLVRYAGGGA